MLLFMGFGRCWFCCLVATLGGILALSAPARAGTVGILVPAYFYPGTGGPGGAGDGWAAMTAAASTVPLTAIFNPNSGPLPGPPDPNYVAAMTHLENAGGHVVAYLFSNSGNTPLATIEAQAQTYRTQYGSLINGFFIDQMLVTPSTLAYYQSLDSFIKGLNPGYSVFGNPGQPFLNGVSPTDYLSTADVFNIFEGPNLAPGVGQPGFDAYPYGQNWFQSYPSSRFSNIVFNVPADAGSPSTSSAMLADLSKAVLLNAGDVYITDQQQPNPYGQLPSYWNQEVAAVQALDVISVPEPASLGFVAGAALCGALAAAARRRGHRPGRILPVVAS